MLAYLSYRQVCVCTGKTVMVVMRIDGDCGCHPASDGDNECGIYRPYFQTYSSDDGQSVCPPYSSVDDGRVY